MKMEVFTFRREVVKQRKLEIVIRQVTSRFQNSHALSVDPGLNGIALSPLLLRDPLQSHSVWS